MLPAWALRSNIRRSFCKVVKDRFQAAGFPAADPGRYAGAVGYNDPLFDPTAIDPRNTALKRFALISVVSWGTGRGLPTLFQVDLYSALGTYDQSTATDGQDRYSSDLDAMVDDFKGIWYPSDGGIKVYDFAVPASPSDTGAWMQHQGPGGGRFALPSDETEQTFDRGLWSCTLTYSCWLDVDRQGQPIYFGDAGEL